MYATKESRLKLEINSTSPSRIPLSNYPRYLILPAKEKMDLDIVANPPLYTPPISTPTTGPRSPNPDRPTYAEPAPRGHQAILPSCFPGQ